MGTDDLQIARETLDLIGRRGFQEDPEYLFTAPNFH
jgi:hypothetical protein